MTGASSSGSKDKLERFTGLAKLYAKHRPTYPEESLVFICATGALIPSSTIADVGSGTGISSRLFAARGYRVIGIEPNEDMRASATADAADYPNLSYRHGTAEVTGLADASVDMVLCAQAFHWFHADKALGEFARVLKKSGWVMLMWNERDEEDAFTAAYGDLLRTFPETALVEMSRGSAGNPLLESSLFDKRKLTTFKNKQNVDLEGLIGRALSTSYAPKDKDSVERFTDELERLFERFNTRGRVEFCYTTSVYSGQKRS